MSRLFLLLLSFAATTVSFSNEIKVVSQIDDVTVFLQGAQVNRSGSVTIPAGTSDVIFTGISPLLKRESLQAGTKANISILAVHYETKTVEKAQNKEELAELEKAQLEKQEALSKLYAKLEVIRTREALIANLAYYQSQNMSATIDDIVKAEQVIASKLEAIKLEALQVEKQIEEMNRDVNQLSQKIAAMGVIYESIEPRVVIKVKAAAEVKAKFTLSYFVSNARWYPSYNLNVKSLDEPLLIDYQANISQQTGEDWKDVKLTLSTVDPNLSGQKPILTPWYLVLNQMNQRPDETNYNRYTPNQVNTVSGRITDQYGEPLPYATVLVVGSTVGTYTDADGFYTLNIPQGKNQISVSFIGYNPVTIYVTANTHNIVLAEKPLMLEEIIVVDALEAENYNYSYAYADEVVVLDAYESQNISYDYSAVEVVTSSSIREKKSNQPRLNKQAIYSPTYSAPVEMERQVNVVSAEFEIEEKYSIPSDEKNYNVKIDEIEKKVFYQYYCAPRFNTDVFLTAQMTDWESLSLLEGQANIFFEGTFVGSSLLDAKFVGDTLDISLGRDKRIVVDRVKEKEFSKYKIVGDEASKSVKWVISVKNNKDVPINLIVEDQFPLTSDSRIQIETDEVQDAKVDETTGIITWDIKLAGSKMTEVSFKYKVTYPIGNDVYLD
ncbi:MAG: mucoidy inhibitor MuiA family protein [Bacteroidetes bacterium]|nr:mucoidy inhibitor MuiA family protein [Bacteroidota bacterium]